MGQLKECDGVRPVIFSHSVARCEVTSVQMMVVYSCGGPVIRITADVVAVVEALRDALGWRLRWIELKVGWEWTIRWMLDQLPGHTLGRSLLRVVRNHV